MSLRATMIGKLVVWRDEHRKDVPEKTTYARPGTYRPATVAQTQTLTKGLGAGLGGLVSIDQLDSGEDARPRSKSPAKALRKVRAGTCCVAPYTQNLTRVVEVA
jgi:hypothetical protein